MWKAQLPGEAHPVNSPWLFNPLSIASVPSQGLSALSFPGALPCDSHGLPQFPSMVPCFCAPWALVSIAPLSHWTVGSVSPVPPWLAPTAHLNPTGDLSVHIPWLATSWSLRSLQMWLASWPVATGLQNLRPQPASAASLEPAACCQIAQLGLGVRHHPRLWLALGR